MGKVNEKEKQPSYAPKVLVLSIAFTVTEATQNNTYSCPEINIDFVSEI